MAFVVPFLPYIAAAFTAVSAIQQGQAAKKAGEHNAAVATRNAGVAREQASADAEAQQRHVNKVMGASRATIAASGITNEGSPIDVLAASAGAGELDRQLILYKGELRAMGYEETSVLEMSKGKAAEKTGYISAGAALFGGAYGRRDPKPKIGYSIGDYENPD